MSKNLKFAIEVSQNSVKDAVVRSGLRPANKLYDLYGRELCSYVFQPALVELDCRSICEVRGSQDQIKFIFEVKID